MKFLLRLFAVLHALMAALFGCAAVGLIAIAAHIGWESLAGGLGRANAQHIIEAVGLLAAAVVALQISQTITEEEVIRAQHISAPTRVRRFLSRFLVVVVIALVVEALIGTFKALRDDVSDLVYVAGLLASVGFLLLSWGAFVWFNRAAEELEPEAMEQALSLIHI